MARYYHLWFTYGCVSVKKLKIIQEFQEFFSHFQCNVAQHSVQVSLIGLLVTPWRTAHQVSLSITNSLSLLKLMSIKSVIPSNHLILCCPLLISSSVVPFSSCLQSFLASGSFPMSWLFKSDGLSTGASASATIFPMNIQN